VEFLGRNHIRKDQWAQSLRVDYNQFFSTFHKIIIPKWCLEGIWGGDICDALPWYFLTAATNANVS